jgi:hypothetical protein
MEYKNIPIENITEVTNRRYKNKFIIWGRPKGLYYGDLIDSAPEQKANLYPDLYSTYFVANVKLPQDTILQFQGTFPHARYFSMTVANQLGDGQIGNGQFLRGDQVIPDRGSENPFWALPLRNCNNRAYTIRIKPGCAPDNPEKNTLYSGSDNPDARVHIAIRTYLVDNGYDGTGICLLEPNLLPYESIGLPTAKLLLSPYTSLSGSKLLQLLQVKKEGDPNGYQLDDWLSHIRLSNDPESAPCLPVSVAQKFWNTDYSVTGLFYATDPEKRVQCCPPSTAGGFASNPDTNYIIIPISFAYGDIVHLRAKMPTHPCTRHNNSSGLKDQVQYLSITTGAGPSSGQGWDTVYDEQLDNVLDDDGFYNVIICWPWKRSLIKDWSQKAWLSPANGEGRNVGARCWVLLVYLRFQNCHKDWAESPGNIPMPTIENPIPQDAKIMKEYYPIATYISDPSSL